jgi:hypothetical protein
MKDCHGGDQRVQDFSAECSQSFGRPDPGGCMYRMVNKALAAATSQSLMKLWKILATPNVDTMPNVSRG